MIESSQIISSNTALHAAFQRFRSLQEKANTSGPIFGILGHMQIECGIGVRRKANHDVPERQRMNVNVEACHYWLVGNMGTVLSGRKTTRYKHNETQKGCFADFKA